MPALNFKKQFAEAVEYGEKRQTIRAPRKDGRPHAKVPLSMGGRRFSLGDHCGDTFEAGEEYDGIALVIEIRDANEAKAVLAAIMDAP